MLVHFLWQGMIIAILAWLIVAVLRPKSANARYFVFVGGLVLMTVCAAVTFAIVESGGHESRFSITGPGVVVSRPPNDIRRDSVSGVGQTDSNHFALEGDVSVTTLETDAMVPEDSTGASPLTSLVVWRTATPFIVVAYFIGVAVLLVRLSLGLRGGRRLRRHSEPVNDASLLSLLARRGQALQMRVSPALCRCRDIAVPTVVGILRPTILLPMSLVAELSPD